MPDAEREWSLNAKKRSKRGEQEGVNVKVCPKCFCVVISQTQVCPDCQHVFTETKPRADAFDGNDEQLIELTPESILERQEKRKRKAQIGQARTLDELIALGKERNYKPGWAHYIYGSRQIKRYGSQK